MYEVLAADSGSEKEQRFIGFDVEAAGASTNGLEPQAPTDTLPKGSLSKSWCALPQNPFLSISEAPNGNSI